MKLLWYTSVHLLFNYEWLSIYTFCPLDVSILSTHLSTIYSNFSLQITCLSCLFVCLSFWLCVCVYIFLSICLSVLSVLSVFIYICYPIWIIQTHLAFIYFYKYSLISFLIPSFVLCAAGICNEPLVWTCILSIEECTKNI